MRFFPTAGIWLFLFLISNSSNALIQNNVIINTDYSICLGAKSPRIVGASPVGGTIPYSFQWIVSTTDSMSGFAPGPGNSDGINYIPPLFTQTTWFRRVVMSAGELDTSAALTVTVLPHPHPSAGYIVNQAVQCFTGNFYSFTDTSTVSSGSLVSHTWDFGDVTYSSMINPTKVYNNPFNFNVKLVVITDHGCRDSMIRTMSVLMEPEADFATDSMEQCMRGNSFHFIDASTILMGSLTSHWYFGDNTDSVSSNLTKTYLNPGTYTVKIVSISDYNCKDSVSKTITVHPNPKAGFIINDDLQCLAGNLFVFTDTSSGGGAQLTSRWWDFGNGDTASGSEVPASYASTGNFEVTLVSQNEYGCRDTAIRSVSVNAATAAGFTIDNDSQCLSGNSFSLQDTSASQSRTWYFSNGGTSTAANPVVSFPVAGTYMVSLVSVNTNGCTDSVTQNLVVHPQPAANTISGDVAVFPGYENNYSVTETAGSYYTWFCMRGTITGGNDTSDVHILWGDTLGAAFVKVIETSIFGCVGDTGILSVVINAIPDSLSCDRDTILLIAAAAFDSISIDCNTSWSVNTIASWITALPTQGTGDSVVHLAFTANSGPKRQAAVSIVAGTASKNIIVIQDGSVGVNEVSVADAVNIYPNPSTGLFRIYNNSNVLLNAALYSPDGKLICENAPIGYGEHFLSYPSLPEGVYVLHVFSSNSSRFLRLVIAR